MNTTENKYKFFAQYYGQKVLCGRLKATMENDPEEMDFNTINISLPQLFLYLKPLSSITDEDAVEAGYVTAEHFNEYNRVKYNSCLTLGYDEADFIRSKGYALPWNGITVEQQIEFGWIKLREI